MKSKEIILVLLIINSLILPLSFISFSFADLTPANDEITWGVKEGKTYTWVVKQSTEILGFLPEDSEIKITVTSIRVLGDGNITELKANITEYNSVTKLTTTILNNETFIYFDLNTSTVILYTNVDDHGLFLPPDYKDYFGDGLMEFYSGFFSTRGYMTLHGIFTFYGYRGSTNLVYTWTFNQNGITDNFVAVFLDADPDDPEDFQYWLVLKTSSSKAISLGNFIWIFMGFAVISLIYIIKKKLGN